MIELYGTRVEAEQARDAKPAELGKEFYIQREDSGHWAVYFRWVRRTQRQWAGVSRIFNQDRARGFAQDKVK